ncbi:MAG TPA: PRC-barrel domain-containing protein [archaeon]|nr:PRC-barrel domain-containing protein [archaeon]
MPVTVKDVADLFNKDVFTDRGFYAGKCNDLEFDLGKYKIKALVIEAAKGSVMEKVIGGKKGLIVPYSMINAIGDIVIIKHIIGQDTRDDSEEVEDAPMMR